MYPNDDKDKYELDWSSNWIITYSDMITIILCFFILFFTATSKEMSMLAKIKDSLSSQVDELSSQLSTLTNVENDTDTTEEDFIAFLKENDLLDQVKLVNNKNGLLIRFNDSILFDSGKANITETGYFVLNQIGDKLHAINNDVVVEGFTDNVPIHTDEYPSNWELSVARAIQVVKFLTEEKSIEEDRISVSGFGEREPIDTNDTPEGRANNRRIEITIVK